MPRKPGKPERIGQIARWKIAEAVKADGRSQDAIAKEAGIHRSSLHRILSGETDTTIHLRDLCRALGLRYEALVATRDAEERLLEAWWHIREVDKDESDRWVMDLERARDRLARRDPERPLSSQEPARERKR